MSDVKACGRRGALKAGLGFAAGMAALAGATRAQTPDQKVAQHLVNYQTTPNDGKHCSQCVHWVPPNACKLVNGEINPNGWCVQYNAAKPPL